MDKQFKPQRVEEKIYRFWEKGSYFTPKIEPKKKPFVITLPPPNVTGGLHAGHAMYVVEDIMVRYRRMLGTPTLWLPGFDHASIAVEYLVTKQLAEEGKTKEEAGREEFLKRAHKFANESRSYSREQLKKLGFSLDWTRETYTMDEIRSRAVKEAFNRLYKKGLIYQGQYIVNWCPGCKSAISDLENEYQEEKGKLYFIKYGPVTIATTRPETMFADVAVAIHPKDKRYQNLIGKNVPLPLTDREIPIITDEAVDPEFGTGALKITPAHDATDSEIGQRHNLEALVVVNFDGKLTELTGKHAGLSVEESRKRVVEDLTEQELIEKIEDIVHSVGHCQRCGTATEPLISEQWFVKTEPLAEEAIRAVKNGKIKIVPQRFEKTYFHWLENIKDWCISRQLWWGHKIPIEGEEDILDTWFSSALWPISVFGWPSSAEASTFAEASVDRSEGKPSDFEYFYPTTVRETGYDILFFWVAREIMMCLEMTNEVPFEVVYLHGMVRDEKGRKFSKTKGIGFDPLDIIEKHGADALRMALVVGNAPGNDLKIEEEKVVAHRNFANKIWNAARFALTQIETDGKTDENRYQFESALNPLKSVSHSDDKWILEELNKIVKKTTEYLEGFRFDLAAEGLYHFFWHTFCDKYIEAVKPRLTVTSNQQLTINNQQSNNSRKADAQAALATLLKVLETSLKLLHPFMPFVTEEIWQRLREQEELKEQLEESITIAEWPSSNEN